MEPETDRPVASPERGGALYAGYAVEGGLGVLAVLLAWGTGTPLADAIRFSLPAVAWGLVGTLPMLIALVGLSYVSWPPIVRIREIVRGFARQLLLRASWLEIAVLCLLAGIGEELLFRGVLQTLIAQQAGPWSGIIVGGVVFGAVHFLTKTYFVLAAVVGCYLGWMFVATQSLTAPIVAHAVYDFVALAVVLRAVRGAKVTKQGNDGINEEENRPEGEMNE